MALALLILKLLFQGVRNRADRMESSLYYMVSTEESFIGPTNTRVISLKV